MTTPDERRYDFDAMRATMMLLGIVFHACVSFIVSDTGDLWPYQSPQTNLVFDAIVGTIHAFRIPAFFMISGFFGSQQLSRHSWNRVMLKRIRRVLLPFIVCFILIAPIVKYGFFSFSVDFKPFSKESLERYFSLWQWNTVHFWFLYYLIIFHAVQLLLNKIPRRYSSIAKLPLSMSLIIMILAQIGIILFTGIESTNGDYSLTPSISSLLYFFCFYLFGNQIFYHLKTFDRWIAKARWIYIVAITVNTSYLLIRQQTFNTEMSGQILVWDSVIAAINTTLLILATFRLFHTLFREKLAVVQYFSRASYLIYIIHLPILIWTLRILAKWIENPFILAFLLIAITSLLSIILYELQQKYWKNLL